MVQRGEVSLDTPLNAIVPEGTTVPKRNGREITLIHLATHHSSLPNVPATYRPLNTADPFANSSVPELFADLSKVELTQDIGTEFTYSNFGVSLLGQSLANRAREPYAKLLNERILLPLRMPDTGVLMKDRHPRHLTNGHDASGNIVPHWHLEAYAPAGGMYSNLTDMLRFLHANMAPQSTSLGASIIASHKKHVTLSNFGFAAINWLVRVENSDTVYFHMGETAGFHTWIGFNHKTKSGVVILADAASDIEDIGFHLLLPNVPLSPPPVWLTNRKEVHIPEAELRKFVGEYRYYDGNTERIVLEGGKLFAVHLWSKWQLHPESPTSFFFRERDEQMSFTVKNGKVQGLIDRTSGVDNYAQKSSGVTF